MLDEFHEPKPAEKEPKPAEKDPKASIHTEAGPAKTEEETTLDDGFARQLQIGMADLLSEMSDSVGFPGAYELTAEANVGNRRTIYRSSLSI